MTRFPRHLSALGVLIGAAVLAVLLPLGAGAPRSWAGDPEPIRMRSSTSASGATAAVGWHGGPVTTPSGDTVVVLVSDAYSGPPNTPERWAAFFADLIHGTELGAVVVHVAPLSEIAEICGERAIGCYGPGMMFVPGEGVPGVTPEMVATHEYGHHVGLHRLNPPWVAIDWGTKRWATHMEICPRAETHAVFPGDEDSHYMLNPGEGFVEAYRVLNEVRDGATAFSWPIVDQLFYPDPVAPSLVELDVLRPWTGPTTTVVRARFRETGKRVWSTILDLPLDGTLEITATMPLASGYSVTLMTVDGARVLARARWTSGAPSRALSYTTCGMRGVLLRLWRTGGPGVVTMRVATP